MATRPDEPIPGYLGRDPEHYGTRTTALTVKTPRLAPCRTPTRSRTKSRSKTRELRALPFAVQETAGRFSPAGCGCAAGTPSPEPGSTLAAEGDMVCSTGPAPPSPEPAVRARSFEEEALLAACELRLGLEIVPRVEVLRQRVLQGINPLELLLEGSIEILSIPPPSRVAR